MTLNEYIESIKEKRIAVIGIGVSNTPLLELLLRNRGQVMPRAVLQDRIWGIDSDVTENNLDVHIRLLRKKIMELNGEELIKTMRGVGYYVE